VTISHSRSARDTSVEPALDDLQRKQDALFERLHDGFESRREVLLWCHDASLRTLGQLPDDWFASLFAERYRLTALLSGEDKRAQASEAAAPEDRAAVERAILADDSLVEACRAGMTVLARSTSEYTEEGVDTSSQSYLGMRPALDDLADKQRQVLERPLGFGQELDSRADVREWVRSVIRATKGRDDGATEKFLWSPHRLDALRGEPTSATLHLTLADDLLRPMNAALRETAAVATEQADEDTTSHGTFRT